MNCSSILTYYPSLLGLAGDKCADSECGDRDPKAPLRHRRRSLRDRSSAFRMGRHTGRCRSSRLPNDEETTKGVLDYTVGLDRRAAGNLIAHQDGGDRKWGTSDDDIFNTVDEVDTVRFVGPLGMVAFALRTGFVPGANDVNALTALRSPSKRPMRH